MYIEITGFRTIELRIVKLTTRSTVRHTPIIFLDGEIVPGCIGFYTNVASEQFELSATLEFLKTDDELTMKAWLAAHGMTLL